MTPLETAYRATSYIVQDHEGEAAVRIGIENDAMDRLFERHGATQGVFLTACNPASRRQSAEKNKQAWIELAKTLTRLGHRYLPALHRAEDPVWNEDAFFVLNLSLEAALVLARAYDQNAVVLAEQGREARLIWAKTG